MTFRATNRALEFREVLILRELEGLCYKEIAAVAGIPIGTVMSRLAGARTQLSKCVNEGVLEGGKAMRQLREITKKTTRTMAPRTLIATGLATFI